MGKWTVDNFITSVVGISVGVVVFAMVAIPIISNVDTGNENLDSIISVIPIFIAIGILMACVYMFIAKKA